jgi:indolepyruvate ferredoxin oxidoreductase beta subunit
VRYGDRVHSPLAKKDNVDILVSFEKMDTLRYLDYIRKTGTVIINDEEIYPPAINLGDASYPQDVADTVGRFFKNVVQVNALSIALKAGNIRAVNTALLGTLSSYLTVSTDLWERVLRDSFPAKLIDINLEAFRLGRAVSGTA